MIASTGTRNRSIDADAACSAPPDRLACEELAIKTPALLAL